MCKNTMTIILVQRPFSTSWRRKGKPFLIFYEGRDGGIAALSAVPYQIFCTSPYPDNLTSTSSLNFYRLDALSDAQPTVLKH